MFEPLERASIAKNVIDQIRGAMERGDLRRGDKLPPEPELARQLKVSRGSLRETLKVLEVLGILEVRRGSGTFVAEQPNTPAIDPLLFLLLLQDGDRGQLVELRFMIEVGFTRLAQEHLTEEHFERLERSIEAMEAAVAAGDAKADHDIDFHSIILEATGNPFVIQVGTTLMELVRDSIGRGLRVWPDKAVAHHRLILTALREGGAAEIEEAVRKSFDQWKDLAK